MRKLLAGALILMTAASAAQVSETETNNRLGILAAQRNSALDAVVVVQARVLALEEELKKARAACPGKAD